MQVTAPGKLWALIIVIAGCFAVIIASAIAGDGADVGQAWAAIGIITTYLVTNGVGAARGQASAQVFAPPARDAPVRVLRPAPADVEDRVNALIAIGVTNLTGEQLDELRDLLRWEPPT